jgi:hypothetical protein
MKIYKTQQEVEADIKDGVLAIDGDVKFECPISINASIIVNAGDINARNINALDINALDINARNINALDINARNINALDINALDINARNISYYAFCSVYYNIKCKSIKARRTPAHPPVCLNGELEIIKDEPVETIKIGDKTYNKQEIEEALKDIKSIN